MRARLAILLVHLGVGAVLWVLAILDRDPVSFYSTVLFFLWNAPSVWVLKALGLSATMDALNFAYGGPIMAAITLLLLGAVLFATYRGRRHIGV
jgi:hypothetical protein